ncbi:MAG: acyl-CoA dehydratase activase [Thermodesulfobacteriota bacterium]
MTIVAGCDVGSLTSKAVIMKEDRIIGSAIIRSKARPEASAHEVMEAALAAAGVDMAQIAWCVGTGYGRDKIPFVNQALSEIACHGKGAHWMVPSARTVIDIGGQDCKAMRLAADGTVENFVTNDKCASGTGRFLEVMADVLHIDIGELGQLSAKSRAPITLASTCTVWAQADVIKYVNSKHPIEDIGAGINSAMAKRVAILANTVKIEKEVVMTGGVAKNAGVVATLEKLLGQRLRKIRKADPQLAGAIGAAVFASENVNGHK